MFLDNKYTKTYFRIIEAAKSNIKETNDGKQTHHIIPRCMGGTDDPDNLVVLTYKQHRVCHRLLIEMTTGEDRKNLSYAYSWFGKSAGNYRTGKDNNFARPEVIELVRKRMKENNPMKNPNTQQKRLMTWKANRALKTSIPPRVLKDKFITPQGIYKSKKDIQKYCGIPEWTLNTIYNNLDACPVSNGRASKKINHLNIDTTKTWRENGFDLLSVS
jgi:hypothetical protein